MTTTADLDIDTVLDAVSSIVPTLRENGLKAEDQRWIPDENLDLLEKAGVFRLTGARRFGGFDASLADQNRVLTEIARGCGSTSWVTSVWLASGWIARGHTEQAQQEIFGDNPGARVSGVFTPTGTLTPVEGGYLLNGSWKFNTGCHGAHWNGTAALLERPDGTTDAMATIFPMSEMTIADDWHVSSAAATGSSTTTATDVFVPDHRVQPLSRMVDPTLARSEPEAGTSRDYGMGAYVAAQAVAVYTGIARGAFDLFVDRLPGRGIAYTSWTDQSTHPLTHIQVATAANKITAAEELNARSVDLVQRRADEATQLTVTERAQVRGESAYAIQLSREAVEILYNASGASSISRQVPIQRFLRDIQGLSLHGLSLLSANMELHGRVLLGLEPDSAFV